MSGNSELQRRLGSIEELLRKIDATADPSLRATVQELVELVMNLHGAALERALELIISTGDSGDALIERLGSDELVGNTLVLHGIHPLTLEARVRQAFDKVCSRLHLKNGELELLGFEAGTVRLKLHAKSQGCGSTSLKQSVEEAMYQAAPDLSAVLVEGAEEKQSFVPLEMLQGASLAANGSKGGL